MERNQKMFCIRLPESASFPIYFVKMPGNSKTDQMLVQKSINF